MAKIYKRGYMKKYLKDIYPYSKDDYFELLHKDLINGKKRFIVTVNPESIMLADKDEILQKILLDKKVSKTPDGIAIVKACKKLNINITERITGIDIATFLLTELNKTKKTLYLLGAKEEVLNILVEKIKKDYPNIKIVGYKNGYIENKDKIFKEIIKVQPDVCLVALGIPNQEKLIYKYIDQFKKGIFVGVGGSFDVLSGTKKRAPKIFIKLNLEWLYRIIKEPKRIKRFWNNNVKFIFKINNNK